ncbi:hypothetical protein E2562_031903 [Oryza meyeriana var. granulata]|uniref:F-box domain-containing protein n=1 Tax=Oryza meyeriana var. granulata TaxID=110450 RepID=A0A6G1DA38_9ORYZ|nr:hypothetical protein E2562_031903 [Oryza meyeriana var. granulata]
MGQPENVSLPDLHSKPWIINLNETEEETEVETHTFISPFEGIYLKTTSPILEGKQCLRCMVDWLLLFDEQTKECYLSNIISHSKVCLPPLLEPLDNLSRCALSSPTTLPDSTIMFACSNFDTFILYCRPGDEEWTKCYVDFQGIDDCFLGTIFGGDGRMYVDTNWKNSCVVINTSSSSVYVEKIGIAEPKTCPLHKPYSSFWVESNGDVFLVRLYCHSYHSSGVVDVDVHRMNTSEYVWERVEDIGDATFFLGSNSVGLSSTVAGTQPNCIYFLLSCCDGIRLYIIQLDARTISFTLLPGCANTSESTNAAYWSDYWYGLYWAIPQSFKLQPSNSLDVVRIKFNRNLLSEEGTEQANEAPWSNIPIELLELLVPKLSFIDYFHVQAVCKEWSLMTKSIQYTETYPMLMSFCSQSTGAYKLFDPLNEKEYTIKDNLLCSVNRQTLRFSKHGWILLTIGHRCIFAVNPFTREVFRLPRMRQHLFNGISFSSFPKSPDSIVFAICKNPWNNSFEVILWRAGDKHWTKKHFSCDVPFCVTYSNPVFFDNEFYCLGIHGNLGVFNPGDMTWRVLEKPEPIRADAPIIGDRYCYLLEFRGDLIAVCRPYDDKPIEMFKLDQSRMAWIKLERLDDAFMFLDNWSAAMTSSPEHGHCNRIYLPVSGYGDCKVSAFYDLETRKYQPAFYGLVEPINSIWMEPSFSLH